jgi:hypothetical protein
MHWGFRIAGGWDSDKSCSRRWSNWRQLLRVYVLLLSGKLLLKSWRERRRDRGKRRSGMALGLMISRRWQGPFLTGRLLSPIGRERRRVRSREVLTRNGKCWRGYLTAVVLTFNWRNWQSRGSRKVLDWRGKGRMHWISGVLELRRVLSMNNRWEIRQLHRRRRGSSWVLRMDIKRRGWSRQSWLCWNSGGSSGI